jgi:hypothetical protein
MIYRDDLDAMNHAITVDLEHAQLIVRITGPPKEVEAEEIIKSLGIYIVSKALLSKDWIRYTLSVKDMRDAALKLTEKGFVVKGINALP